MRRKKAPLAIVSEETTVELKQNTFARLLIAVGLMSPDIESGFCRFLLVWSGISFIFIWMIS